MKLNERINLTGNFLVDTGLAVIASRNNLKDINDLKYSHIELIKHDLANYADELERVPSYGRLFSQNCLLLQNSFKKDNLNKPLWISFMNKLSTLIMSETPEDSFFCECCGEKTSLDYKKLYNEILTEFKKSPLDDKYIGRDVFPLSGSLTNDAQMLPASSRSLIICEKCLFAVQLAALGSFQYKGKIAFYQCSSFSFIYKLIKSYEKEIRYRLTSSNEKIILPGGKNYPRETIEYLISTFRDLEDEDLDNKNKSLFIYYISNDQTTFCDVDILPDKAINFLYRACLYDAHENSIKTLLNLERSNEKSLYFCLIDKTDYRGFYNKKPTDKNFIPVDFFRYYQTKFLNCPESIFNKILSIAIHCIKNLKIDEIKEILRDNFYSNANQMPKNYVLKEVLKLAEQKKLDAEDFLNIFSNKEVRWNFWSILYFLILNESQIKEENASSLYEEKIQPSKAILQKLSYIQKIHNEINLNTPNLIKSLNEKKIITLSVSFINLSLESEGFTYLDYESLVYDQNKKFQAYHILDALRIFQKNPIDYSNFQSYISETSENYLISSSGINNELAISIIELMKTYMEFHDRDPNKIKIRIKELFRNNVSIKHWLKKQIEELSDCNIKKKNQLSDDILEIEEFKIKLLLTNFVRLISK